MLKLAVSDIPTTLYLETSSWRGGKGPEGRRTILPDLAGKEAWRRLPRFPMFSNLKPCPEGKIAHAQGSNKERILRLCLAEDRTYSRGEVLRALSEASQLNGEKAEELYEAVRTFLAESRDAIIGAIRGLYSDTAPLDAFMPRVGSNLSRSGEFPGSYVVYEKPRLVST